MDKVKVLLVDDHTIFRRGIAMVLADQEDIEVVGEASDGNEAVAKATELSPDVVLMDLNMPNCGGLEATQRLQEEMPQIQVLVLTVSEKEDDLFSAIKSGAKGYMLKETEPDDLVQAVRHIAKGGVIVSPVMASSLLGELRTEREIGPDQKADTLSKREVEVLQQVAKGASNKGIASTLFISENTVKTHLRNILDKLHLANRSQAAAYAVRAGLTRKDDFPTLKG